MHGVGDDRPLARECEKMMQELDLAPHVEEIARALQERVEHAVIEGELRRYLEFGVPLLQAKKDIVRNHGGSLRIGKRTLEELSEGDRGVDLLVRVLAVFPKEVLVQGKPRKIFWGYVSDPTARVPFTSWKDHRLEKGKVYEISNAYVKKGLGESVEIQLGDYTRVVPSSEELVIPPSLLTLPERPLGEVKVQDLREGLGSATVVVRVLQARERKTPQGTKILEGIVADETGKAPFTAWPPRSGESSIEKLVEGAVVRIERAYVRSRRGVPTLTLGDLASVHPEEDSRLPPLSVLEKPRPISLGRLSRVKGAVDALFEGVILEVRKGSGLVQRCPTCRRVLLKRECRLHGKVEGSWDLRVKGILDDGWGVATFVLGREATERLSGKTLEEWQRIAKEAMTTDVVEEELQRTLGARSIVLRGNAFSDEFGVFIVASEALPPPPLDVEEEAHKILDEIGEVIS